MSQKMIRLYYKDIESYVVVDLLHGLFIQVFRESFSSCIKIKFNRIYAYQINGNEPNLSMESALINNLFPNAQTITPVMYEEIDGIKISFKLIDEYLITTFVTLSELASSILIFLQSI